MAERVAVTRADLLRMALGMRDPAFFERAFRQAPDDIQQRAWISLREWVRYGAQSVELSHTYAAALMATDSAAALEGQPLPWPAFEIQVPAGLLTSSHGEVFSVFVVEPAREHLTITGRAAGSRLFVSYFDPLSTAVNSYTSLSAMFDGEFWARAQGHVSDELAAALDMDREKRIWAMVARLIGGVVLSITQARALQPELYGPRPLREKHGALKPAHHRVGAPLTIDCRQSIRDFVTGVRRSEPHVQTLVRGHWRNQPHGPERALRRLQWICPHYRGEGPLLMRPVRLREERR